MMRYNVGDRVRVRKDLEIGRLYGICYVTRRMHNLCGEIVRITEVNEHRGEYRIDSCDYYWTDEMFEDIDMEVPKMDKHVVIDVDENKVVARRGDKRGVARCHPDDTFDFYVGAKIALERLEDAEKPYAWLKEGMTYYIPDITYAMLHRLRVYSANEIDKRHMEHGIVFKTREEAIECAKKMLAVVKQEG